MDERSLAQEREQKLRELHRSGAESSLEREAKQRGMPYTNISGDPRQLKRDVIALIPQDDAERGRIVALEKQQNNLRVGVVDPDNTETLQVMRRLSEQGFVATPVLISPPSFSRALEEYKQIPRTRDDIGDTVHIGTTTPSTSTLVSLKEAAPKAAEESTSALFELLLASGLELGASDLHIEPTDSGARLRLRLDGILQDVATITPDVYRRLLSRIKVVAHIPLNITSTAHDGRFTVARNTREAEVRVSILPSPEGEYLVLRLLNPDAVALSVSELGLEQDLWDALRPQLELPNGIVLTTGPTGSGKTTTLYAFLAYLKKPEVKIVTLENPIEYHLDGISQTQIEDKKGYGFAEGIRATLRHDPDIILVGEIRDGETAETALHAALTGHLVLSTLHTNDAAGAVPRFLDLNAKPPILASALRAVIAQRLVRRLCDACKKPLEEGEYQKVFTEIEGAFQKHPQLLPSLEKRPPIFAAKGCIVCSETGYQGRAGVFELLVADAAFEELLSRSPTHHEVQTYADERGFQSMYINGLRKVVQGSTTLDEVHRVTTPGT